MTWQPIETAARDGTEIILGAKGWSNAGFWHDGSDNYWERAGWYDESDRANILTAKPNGATHWQLLPEPPE